MMKNVQLGFKAFDPHELLCHFIANSSGLYQRENLNITLVDITFTAECDLPADLFQVSCGSALSSALRGHPQRILFVATDNPMFWIVSSKEIENQGQLKNKKIATYPPSAPPHHLANMILKKSGIDIDTEIELRPARDDTARFGLLKSASVDAAVISSIIPPAKVEQAGFNILCFFGDEIRIPTTGLAIAPSYLEKEQQLAETLVGILKESLSIIHNEPDRVAAVLGEYFDLEDKFKNATAKDYQQYYSRDGTTTEAIAQNGIDSLCESLAIPDVPDWKEIYCFPD